MGILRSGGGLLIGIPRALTEKQGLDRDSRKKKTTYSSLLKLVPRFFFFAPLACGSLLCVRVCVRVCSVSFIRCFGRQAGSSIITISIYPFVRLSVRLSIGSSIYRPASSSKIFLPREKEDLGITRDGDH